MLQGKCIKGLKQRINCFNNTYLKQKEFKGHNVSKVIKRCIRRHDSLWPCQKLWFKSIFIHSYKELIIFHQNIMIDTLSIRISYQIKTKYCKIYTNYWLYCKNIIQLASISPTIILNVITGLPYHDPSFYKRTSKWSINGVT